MSAPTGWWSREAINRAWDKRTLRILVSPSPVTFAERRSVLQVLQQKGAIEVFQKVTGQPSQFIVVAKKETTVQELRRAGRLTYTVASPEKLPDIRYVDLARPDLVDGTKATISQGDAADRVGGGGQVKRQFTVNIFNLPEYNHGGTAYSSPLYGKWPHSYTRHPSFMSTVLKQSLPHNMAAAGLSRWDYNLEDTGEQTEWTAKKARLQVAKWMPTKMKGPEPEESPEEEARSWQKKSSRPLKKYLSF